MGTCDGGQSAGGVQRECRNDVDAQRAEYGHIKDYFWGAILAADGKPFASLKQKYDYRDYFHGPLNGRLSDFKTGPPLEHSHISIAMESTHDGLIVVLSTPIKPHHAQPPLGVITMAIEIVPALNLGFSVPVDQKVIVVDARRYFMEMTGSEQNGPSGEGLILYYNSRPSSTTATPSYIDHLPKSIVEEIIKKKK